MVEPHLGAGAEELRCDVRAAPRDAAEAAVSAPERAHPLLFATAEELARARERARRYEWARATHDGITAAAQQALASKVAVPDKGGQWTHYYNCPKHGARLQFESPTRHVCPVAGEVFRGWPYDDVAISFAHHSYTADLEHLGLAYALTGELRYAERAREILLAYADKYPRYQLHDTQGEQNVSGGKRFAQTLDEAVDLVPVAWAYDLICNALTADDRSKIEQRFLRPSVEAILGNPRGRSNWQSWHNAAVAAVGFCIGDDEMVRIALDDPHNGFRYQMRESVLTDGSWYEGAPSYHFYALAALLYVSEAAYRAGTDLYDARYKSLFEAPLDLAYPDLTLPALNDSDRSPLAAQERLYEVAYQRFGDERLGAVLGRGTRTTWQALLWGAETLPTQANLTLRSANLAGLGCAVLRDSAGEGDRYLLLDYGPHGGGHGHPEKLQIVLYGLGQELAPDAGRLAYSVPLHRTWFKQTLAHNTIVLDQRSQQSTEGKLTLFHVEPRFQAARAVAADAYPGLTLDRTVIMLPRYMVDVFRVHPQAATGTAGVEHTYDWVYHNHGRLRVDQTASDLPQPLGTDNGYEHVQSLRRAEAAGAWRAAWQVDGGRVRLTAADGCGPCELLLAEAPAPPQRPGSGPRRMPLVICRRRGEGAVFVTAIETAREQPAVRGVTLGGWVGPPSARGLSIEVVTDHGTDMLWIADNAAAHGAQVVYVPAGEAKHVAP
jgi:hypothetical protein